jgi:hypothetical protein
MVRILQALLLLFFYKEVSASKKSTCFFTGAWISVSHIIRPPGE